ncbi:MAG: helix-turn-helix transcriptional regulator, partial [Burkholderiales bacterium]|nr:helix-turn-helix transcriptional regulator [Burkholderiales bacterium]
EAAARGARREAAAHCRAALAQGGRLGDAERADLLDALAAHSFELNDLAAAIDAGEAAVALHARRGDAARQSASWSALAMSLVRALRNAQADAASRRAIELAASAAAGGSALARALATESYLRMLNRDCGLAVARGEEAIALALAVGDAATAARATLAAATATMYIDYAQGVARLEQLLLEASRVDDGGVLLADTHQMLGTASAELHRFDVAEAHLGAGIAVARRLDLDRVAGYMESWQAICDLHRGRWTLASERAHAAVRAQAAGSTNRIVALVALARVRIRRGDPGADELLDEALALALQSDTLQRLGLVAAARAEAASLRGDEAAALREASRAIALAAAKRHPWLLGELAYWRARAVRRLADGVDGDGAALAAAIAADAAEPYRWQIDGDWARAAAAWRARGCPYEEARALGEGDETAQRAAIAALDRLGARPLAEQIRRALRVAGVRAVPRGASEPTRQHAAGLTRRESEVLALLARGFSNARIAATLSRSPRTIEHHVEAILGKFAVTSRAAAVAAARERGLLVEAGRGNG